MIRVTITEEQSLTTVTIDGQLSNDSIAIVKTCCDDAIRDGKQVELFLRDITTVDPSGELLLSHLAVRCSRQLA
jgi:ABC-type transporter Mla MlaB component